MHSEDDKAAWDKWIERETERFNAAAETQLAQREKDWDNACQRLADEFNAKAGMSAAR